MNIIINNQKKEINIGLALLKIYLSFVVVNIHCFDISNGPHILKNFLINGLHVPTFFIISFYFFSRTLLSRNLDKFKQRFQRLLIPYIIWPIIIFIFNNLLYIIFKINLSNSFYDLESQLLTGHSFIPPLWFQWCLIFQTFLFIVIELIFHKYIIFIFLNIKIVSYFLQYSSINYYLFENVNKEQKYTFGRILEIFPYSISGFFIAYFEIIIKFKKDRIKTIYLCIIVFSLYYKYDIIKKPIGFYYQGLKLNIQSICLFICFSLIPKNIIPKSLTKITKQISLFSPGIYYLHYPLLLYFENLFLSVKKRTIYGSLFIYIISYLASFIGNKFVIKTKLKNLFQ